MRDFKPPPFADEIEPRLWAGDLHFLNTTIVPIGADGVWRVGAVDVGYVRHMLLAKASACETAFAVSHIGHQATAEVASELFGQPLSMDRTPWDGKGIGVALQLNGRLPEGQILGRAELDAMGYNVRLLYKIND